jgi:hypothetical protein
MTELPDKVYEAMKKRKRLQEEIKNPGTLLEKEKKRLAEVRYRSTWKTYRVRESSKKCKKLDQFKEVDNDAR